jgi:hypothetical protein
MPTLSEQRKEKSNLVTSGSVLVGIPIAYFGLIMLLNYLNMRPTITDKIHPNFPILLLIIGLIILLVGVFKKIPEA